MNAAFCVFAMTFVLSVFVYASAYAAVISAAAAAVIQYLRAHKR